MTTVYQTYAGHVADAIAELVAGGDLPAGLDTRHVTVEAPRDASHGDLATNAAMVLAKPAGRKPREIAVGIAQYLVGLPDVTVAEVAGPGFLNIRLAPGVWAGELAAILSAGPDYGRSTMGGGRWSATRWLTCSPMPGST